MPQQVGVVVDARRVTVVGDPVQDDRVVRRRAPAGELEVQPVLGLEVLPRRARDVGPLALQPEDVRDRVLARERGRATGAADPRAQLARLVALHAARAPPTTRRVSSAPRASIQMIASCNGVPSRSIGTVPDHCDVTATATTSSGATVARSITRCAAADDARATTRPATARPRRRAAR